MNSNQRLEMFPETVWDLSDAEIIEITIAEGYDPVEKAARIQTVMLAAVERYRQRE